MLRMIRSTLLYDSIVLRLDNQLDRYQEYMDFMKYRAQYVNRRWRKRLQDNAGDNIFLNLEELGSTFNDLLIRVQSLLSRPVVNFGSTVNKWVFTVSVLSRLAGRILFITLALVGLVEIVQYWAGLQVSFMDTFRAVASSKLYLAFFGATILFSVRLMLFRLRDRDTADTNRR
jgi:hypothetical protein